MARACGPYALAWRESVLWLKKYPQVFPRIVDHMKASAFQMATGRAVDLILPVLCRNPVSNYQYNYDYIEDPEIHYYYS